MNNNELTPEQIAALLQRASLSREIFYGGATERPTKPHHLIQELIDAINQLTEQVATLKKEHRIMMINCKSEDDADNREIESMQAKIEQRDARIEGIDNDLVRISKNNAELTEQVAKLNQRLEDSALNSERHFKEKQELQAQIKEYYKLCDAVEYYAEGDAEFHENLRNDRARIEAMKGEDDEQQ